MKYNKAFLSALLLSVALAAPSYAAESNTTTTSTETKTRVVRPLAIDGETQEVKPAIQRFVERINMARLNLADSNAKEAQFDLDEAEKHMHFIKNNSNYKEVTKSTVIASGQVVYDGAESTTYNSYYVPLEEGPVVVKEYATTDNQGGKSSRKAIAVKSAKTVYLTIDLSGDAVEKAIGVARANIKEGNSAAADEVLAKMLADITVANTVESNPEIVARDNLTLALNFLQDNNYVAARFALASAMEAVQKMLGEKAAKLTKDINQIRDLTMQENESAAQKARTQIKAVRGDLEKMS
jgi:hypothetical protein